MRAPFWVVGFVVVAGCGSDRASRGEGQDGVDAQAEVQVGDAAGDTEGDTEGDAYDDSGREVAVDDVEVEPNSDVGVEAEVGGDTTADTGPPAGLILNEFDCGAEWVELVNVGTSTLSLTGWALTDDATGRNNRVELSGELVARGRLAVKFVGFGLACGEEGPALLWNEGLVEAAPPGNAPGGYTFGRFPDATGEWVVTAPTRGEINRLPDVDPFDPASGLFGWLRPIATIALTLPASTVDALWQDPYAWVPATFAWREAGADLGPPQPVAVRVKGRIGSYRDLNGKTAFKLDFSRFWPGGEFSGLDEMTLNNMVQDYNRVNEVLAYDLFRRMGVPVPRLSYVWLTVNGEPFGLYLNLEALDGRWRARHFPSTLGMFEGAYGEDLFPGTAFRFDLDGGVEAARLALDALVMAVDEAPQEGFMASLEALVDWDEVLAMMATEVFIGHWDGYGPTRNNYFLHFDASGVLRLVPWGLDQTFGGALPLFDGQGLLLQGCVRDPECRTAWEDALGRVASLVREPGYLGWADALADHLQPLIEAEPREDGGDARGGLDSAWSYLENRATEVEAMLTCVRSPGADRDGDGYSCDQDCDEEDPLRFVGATDTCGDGIDQDCNGRADDAEGCPDCYEVELVGFGRYRFCWSARSFADASVECESGGGRLVVFESDAELTAVLDELDRRGIDSAWAGLTDIDEEGVFRWVDGTVWDGAVGGWLDGQPDDWQGGEDCAEIVSWGGERPWNDLFCDREIAAVCEQVR